jgi:hypothetical protein
MPFCSRSAFLPDEMQDFMGILTSCLIVGVVVGDAAQAARCTVVIKTLIVVSISRSAFRLVFGLRCLLTFSRNDSQSVCFVYSDGLGLLYMIVVLIVPMMGGGGGVV